MAERLLDIEDLKTYFFTGRGVVKAVDGVDLFVNKGELLGVIGESGSGKTVTSLSVLRVVPRPGKIVDGRILFKGEDILEKSEEEMRNIRGGDISLIFQNPDTSLNPIATVGDQLTEILLRHREMSREEAGERVVKLLGEVEIPEPETRFTQYPYELSGGMKQRIAVSRALLCEPSLLIADEPTTNLDVTIQAQILELIKDLKDKFNMAVMLITHDMGVVAQTSERVVVLYGGRTCEIADTETIFSDPLHPYTEALLRSIPRVDVAHMHTIRLQVIPGRVPDLIDPPTGCRFHPRCGYATEECKGKMPKLIKVGEGHYVACMRVD